MQTNLVSQRSPKSGTFGRWTPKRKAALVADILDAIITPQEACAQHGIDPVELKSWMDDYAHGESALSVSRTDVQRQRNQRRYGAVSA